MQGFAGFRAEDETIALPAGFFAELLPAMDDLAELQVTLFFLRARAKAERPVALCVAELAQEPLLMESLRRAATRAPAETLERALERAAARGVLLRAVATRGDQETTLYLVHDEAGRQVAAAIAGGAFDERLLAQAPAAWRVERPNIFVLYEQNIGMLQPLLVDELREAEKTYPAAWVEEAFQIAVERNARNWRYIRAILDRWACEGKQSAAAAEDASEATRRRYLGGQYGQHIRR